MLADYARHARAAGHTPATVDLRRFILARLERETATPLAEQTAATLEAWLSAHDWSRETRRAARSAVQCFYRWAYAAGRIDADPAAALPRVRPAEPCPRPLPDAMLSAALAAADDRQRLALTLGARLGLRVSEAAAVNVADIEADLIGLSLRVRGKGGKVRTVPLAADVADLIREAAEAGPAGWAFPNPHAPAAHISGNHLGRLCRPLLGGYGFHSLRHRFASAAYSGTGDLLAVCRILGHASPATTQRYIAADAARLHAAARAAA